MSEDISKRGLRVFADWVENGQDWDDEEDAHGVAEGAHAVGQVKKESAKRNTGQRFTEFTEEHAPHASGSVYWAAAQTIYLAGMAALLMIVSHLPAFGSADNLVNNEVAGCYLKDGLSETGAANTVTGIILGYRAFDTLGESVVLFLSAVSVIVLTRYKSGSGSGGRADQEGRRECGRDEEKDIILEQVARLLVPLILIFGLYAVLNGYLSPGGGFSRGTAVGAGLILHVNAFGYRRIHHFFNLKTFTVMSSSVLMVYALSEGYPFFMGVNHLESSIPSGEPRNILSTELILPLDTCVGLAVAGTMYCSCPLLWEEEV